MPPRYDFAKQVAQSYGLVVRVLWLVMTATPLLFVVVAWVITKDRPPLDTAVSPMVEPVLVTVAMLLILGTTVARRVITPEWLVPTSAQVPNALPTGLTLQPESDVERRLIGAAHRYQVLVVVTLAVGEAAAIMGLLLTMLTGQISYVLIFATATVVADILLLRPDPGIYERFTTVLHVRTGG